LWEETTTEFIIANVRGIYIEDQLFLINLWHFYFCGLLFLIF
jgi:hypothetical protein